MCRQSPCSRPLGHDDDSDIGAGPRLVEHTVHTAKSKGWDTLSNGVLLNAAEEAGFKLLLTTDGRIRCYDG